MGISTRQYSTLLRFVKEKSLNYFPSLDNVKIRENEILPDSTITTKGSYGEIDFEFSLKTCIIQILSKNAKRLNFPDNDADVVLNLDLCMKLGNKCINFNA